MRLFYSNWILRGRVEASGSVGCAKTRVAGEKYSAVATHSFRRHITKEQRINIGVSIALRTKNMLSAVLFNGTKLIWRNFYCHYWGKVAGQSFVGYHLSK